jgi:hypothetical protein
VDAWENLYALRRSEVKFRARNKARRSHFEFEVLRSEIIDLVRNACLHLERVSVVKEIYTERDLKGLGKNFMFEESRRRAIEAYRFSVRYYALLGLKDQVQTILAADDFVRLDRVLEMPSQDPRWEHRRRLLTKELGITEVAHGLGELPRLLEQFARGVEASKVRDDHRGGRIIDDYAEAHTSAEDEVSGKPRKPPPPARSGGTAPRRTALCDRGS